MDIHGLSMDLNALSKDTMDILNVLLFLLRVLLFGGGGLCMRPKTPPPPHDKCHVHE